MAFACTPPTGVAAQVVLLVAGVEEREGDGRKRLSVQGEVATVVVVRRGRADRRRGGRRRGGDEQQQREGAHRAALRPRRARRRYFRFKSASTSSACRAGSTFL